MGRWRLDERGRADSERNSDRWRYGEREHTEGLVSEREKEERRKKRLGQSGKGGERRDKGNGRGRTKRPGGFVCWHSQP